MVPNATRFPVPFDYVFPHGVLALRVEPVTDFDKLGSRDDQARDDRGELLWQIRALDLDPEAGKFGRSAEVVVKIAAPVMPVLPEPKLPGYPPEVEFTEMTVTPYADQQRCRDRSEERRVGKEC